MTYKEKAQEIVEWFKKYMYPFHDTVALKQAKQCAIFYVDGKIDAIESVMKSTSIELATSIMKHQQNSWSQVKTEIENL